MSYLLGLPKNCYCCSDFSEAYVRKKRKKSLSKNYDAWKQKRN